MQIRNLRKVYSSKFWGIGRRKDVLAIEDLSFDVPKVSSSGCRRVHLVDTDTDNQGEIFCLLGRNGSSKSTTIGIIARLIQATGGRIRYAKDLHLGIASQKDVLWDELTCEQVSLHRLADFDL